MQILSSYRIQVLAVAAVMFIGGFFLAAGVKKYQVTGKVLEVDDKMIVVDKNGERFEIQRDDQTKVDGEVKVDGKVKVEYRMIAASIEAKPDAK